MQDQKANPETAAPFAPVSATPLPRFVTGLRCLRCGALYAHDAVRSVCACRPNQGSDLGTLDVLYDYDAIRQAFAPESFRDDPDRSIAHYAPLLPIAGRESLPPLPVGNTPLLAAARLARDAGLAALDATLYVKDDGRNPSASFKDRASAIAVARGRDFGFPVVATASTGNAAAALAALSASAGMRSVIFVPQSAPPAKIAQLLVYGSTVLAVAGTYDQAFDLCVQSCHEFGWYNRNTGYNPYMTEGKKTVSFEIAEQLGALYGEHDSFVAPDAVFVSVGDGSIIGGVHKGFRDLLALGWIQRMPRIYGVQSSRSDALARAWQQGREIPEPVQATTVADSIGVDAPRDPVKALAAVRESGGAFVVVPDEEILDAILPLARLAGVFAEPAGAAAYAGVRAAAREGLVRRGERVVVINTGSGLKDIRAALQVAGEPHVISPELRAVQDVMARLSNP